MLADARAALEKFLGGVVVALMASLALLVVAAVILRKAGLALVWYDELASMLMAWLTYYGACLASLKKAHIGFPKLLEAAPRQLRRALVAAGATVTFAFLLLTAWAGWRVLEVLSGESLITLPWLPARLAQSVIPVGAALFVVTEALTMPERWRSASLENRSGPPGNAQLPGAGR